MPGGWVLSISFLARESARELGSEVKCPSHRKAEGVLGRARIHL